MNRYDRLPLRIEVNQTVEITEEMPVLLYRRRMLPYIGIRQPGRVLLSARRQTGILLSFFTIFI